MKHEMTQRILANTGEISPRMRMQTKEEKQCKRRFVKFVTTSEVENSETGDFNVGEVVT